MKLCDVGCGQGHILCDLREIGFTLLVGIDPYLSSEIVDLNLSLLKEVFLGHNSIYEIIGFNHSFERVEEPLDVLKKAHELLTPGEYCIISIPVIDSFVWRQYQAH
jgi:2-polyprenyl-3-methyl-5-hydroxy-6-metoxy-1,4-benzoquinol methylase